MEPEDKQDVPPVARLSTKGKRGIPHPDSPRVEEWMEWKKPDDEQDKRPLDEGAKYRARLEREDRIDAIEKAIVFSIPVIAFVSVVVIGVYAIGLGIWRTIFGWP